MTFSVRPVQCSPEVVSALSTQIEPLTNAEVLVNVNSLTEDAILHNGNPPTLFCVEMRVFEPSWGVLIETLRREWSTVPILILVSDQFDTTTLVDALAAGASDVRLLSPDTSDRLNECLRSLLPGASPRELAQRAWGSQMPEVFWKPGMESGKGVETLEDSESRVLFIQVPASRPDGATGFVALAFQRGSSTPMRVLALDHSSFGTSSLLEMTAEGLLFNHGPVHPRTAFPKFRAWALWALGRGPDIQTRKAFATRAAILNVPIDSRLLAPITAETAPHLQLLKRLGEGSVLKLALTPDGRLAAVWSVAGLSVHEVATGKKLAHLPVEGELRSIDISEDGNLVAAASDGADILLWDLRSPHSLRGISTGPNTSWIDRVKFTGHGRRIVVFYTFTPHEQGIISGPMENRGVLIELETMAVARPWTVKRSPISVLVSPDGNYMVLGFGFGDNELWSLPATRKLRDLGVQGMDLQLFSPDSTLLALEEGPSWAITRIETGEVIQRVDEREIDDHKPNWLKASQATWSSDLHLETSLPYFTPPVSALAFSHDSRFLFVGAGSQTIRVWDTTSATQVHTIALEQDRHANNVKSIACSPAGDLLAVGREQGPVPILRVPTGETLHQLDAHAGSFWKSKICVRFSPNGLTLVTAGSDGKVRLWTTTDWRMIWEHDLGPETRNSREQKKVHDVCFSGDGRFVGVSHSGGLMTVVHAANGSVAFDLSSAVVEVDEKESPWLSRSSTDREAYCGAISIDGQLAYITVFSGVYEYDLSVHGTPGRRVSKESGPLHEPASWAMAADEKVWFLGGGAVKGVDLKGAIPPIDLRGHIGNVVTTTVSPDAKLLASGGEDGTVGLWGISISPDTPRLATP